MLRMQGELNTRTCSYQNLAGYFVTAIATFLWFLHFSHCWNRRNKLSKSKNRQSALVSGCFSLQKKWKNYLISIFINYTIWLRFCAEFGFLSCKVFRPEPFKNNALPTQAPAQKPYRRSSIRQQPRIYRGPAVN